MDQKSASTKVSQISKEVVISAVKVLIASIPVIGNALNEMLFEIGSRIKSERLEKLITYIAEKIDKLEKEKIDQEYLRSEDFHDLVLEILQKAIKNKSVQKLKALSEIFVRSIIEKSDFDSDLAAIFITYIDELKAPHIELLAFFNEKEQELSRIGYYEKLFKIFRDNFPDSNLDKYEFKLYCSQLEAKVLITTGRGLDDFDAVGGVIALQSYRESSLKITSIGKKFLGYLET